jgi:hypothetical protein
MKIAKIIDQKSWDKTWSAGMRNKPSMVVYLAKMVVQVTLQVYEKV